MSYALSRDLSRLFITATKACRGFYIRGDLEGSHGFVDSLKKNLQENGWPIVPFERGHSYKAEELAHHPMNQFVQEGIAHAPLSGESDRQHSFGVWSRELSEKERSFIVSPETPTILEKSIKAAVEELSMIHGDPFAVKFRTNSILGAVFDAAARKLGFRARRPQEKMIAIGKDTARIIRQYHDQHDVPYTEFRDRIAAELINLGWPSDSYGRLPSDHMHLLDDLTHPLFKTSVYLRFSLQNATEPPQKAFAEAREFVIARAEDIFKATAKIAKDLDAEIASPEGFVTHYVVVEGRKYVSLDKPKV